MAYRNGNVALILIIPQAIYRVIYKKIVVLIMMITHTIFAESNTILFDQNTCLLSYNIMEEDLVQMLLDQDDRANKFCPNICVFARSYDR